MAVPRQMTPLLKFGEAGCGCPARPDSRRGMGIQRNSRVALERVVELVSIRALHLGAGQRMPRVSPGADLDKFLGK